MSIELSNLDSAVARASEVYGALNEPLPTLVAHLESLDPAFDRIPTVCALRALVHDYVSQALSLESVPFSSVTSPDEFLSHTDNRVQTQMDLPAWDDLVALATQAVRETHSKNSNGCDNTSDGVKTDAADVLQLDSFNLWSPGSQPGEGSDYEFHHQRPEAREDEADRAMHIVESYTQQETPDTKLFGDAGSSDSALFPEYRGEISVEDESPAESACITANGMLESATMVLKTHPEWLTQHVQWKAITCAIVRATVAVMSSVSTHSSVATCGLLSQYFHAVGPAQRYLVLTEMCHTLQCDESPMELARRLIPVTLELVRQVPDDWLTWLESEVLHVFVDVIEHVVIPFPDECAVADPTAEWVAQWATRPAFTISVVALVNERSELLLEVASNLIHTPSCHLATLIAHLLPTIGAHCVQSQGRCTGLAEKLCDAVIAFILRNGLPPVSSSNGAVMNQDAVRICISSLGRLLDAVPALHLPHLERWCHETMKVLDVQLDGGMQEVTILLLLMTLLPHLDARAPGAQDVFKHLDTSTAARLETLSSPHFAPAVHHLWMRVLPIHWSLLPFVCSRVIACVVNACDEAPGDCVSPCDSLTQVYSVQHLVALARVVEGWLWLSQALLTTPLCTNTGHVSRQFAHLLLHAIVRNQTSTVDTVSHAVVPRLTGDVGLQLLRWSSSLSAPFRCALLDVARSEQLQSTRRYYSADGNDGQESMRCLADWLLTIPAELIAREPLETSADTQLLLDQATLDQSVFFLVLIGTECAAPFSVPGSLGMPASHHLIAQYVSSTAANAACVAGQSQFWRSLPFGADSRGLLLRLAVVLRVAHPLIDVEDAAADSLPHPGPVVQGLTEPEDGFDDGLDVITGLLCCLRRTGMDHPPPKWLAAALLCGYDAAVDEDDMVASIESLRQSSAGSSNPRASRTTLSDAEELMKAAFPRSTCDDSTVANAEALRVVCALAADGFGSCQEAVDTLSRCSAATWCEAVSISSRANAVVMHVLNANPATVQFLSAGGADVFALACAHVKCMLIRQTAALLGCTAANGLDGLDAMLCTTLLNQVESIMDSPDATLQQNWCVPEDSFLPLPSPLLVCALSSMW